MDLILEEMLEVTILLLLLDELLDGTTEWLLEELADDRPLRLLDEANEWLLLDLTAETMLLELLNGTVLDETVDLMLDVLIGALEWLLDVTGTDEKVLEWLLETLDEETLE